MAKGYSIGPITGILKPKFRAISLSVGEGFNPPEGVDIFLDLNTIVSALSTSQKFLTSLAFADNVETDMIYSILMTLQHWKIFGRNLQDVRYFLIVNDFEMGALAEQDTLKSYLVPYVNKMSGDRYKQFAYYWSEALKRIEIILKYVPNSYLIRCERFDSFIVPEITWDYEHTGRRRLIVTGNSLFTNYVYMPNTTVILRRYKKTGMSQLSEPAMIVQAISHIDDEVMSAFIKNRVFYNLLNAIIGDFDRGIIGLTPVGLSAFANDLIRAVERHEIPEDPSSIESVLPVVDEKFHSYLRQVYPLVDIPSHAKLIKPSMIEKMKSNMVDMYDIDGLRSLSIEGFNLIELL